ncbi:16S rRNA (uracil(1498)-N(3))-methyltransferase [Salinibacillus xinjiangensis]|uniref:Ribosomal RNA small subunit methyltransferase E n=1 Tax=Salinibacillus xinjiangensis TaxID=1229268 RepID=A0A6G1X6Q0_9BACI|nr:16S rRNA (uracil(1498)-N(3))-methyltransferase [Salinibacillus xinjiangensis]MRG86644.1 16S rRNA (uracil(1498)-N(3))-methyltransferase [Salinibacillus xinjiangensis]
MQRYFIPQSGWTNQQVEITNDDAHHISKVMRMKPEDQIYCCHPDGKTALCEIEEITNGKVICHIVEWITEHKELPVHITIAQGLPKGDKLDLIVQKGTELGASAFIPFNGERSVVKWDDKKANKKITRLSKIAKEASEQSHRTKIPTIHELESFSGLLQKSEAFDHCIVASEVEAKKDTPTYISDLIEGIQPDDHVLVVIGPEGGFSDQELAKLAEKGFGFTRFGPRILRTETAPLYFLAVMSYQFEELR